MMRDFYAHEAIAFDQERAARALKGLFADESLGRIFLIEREGEAVGYLVLTYVYSLEFGGRCGLIDELYLVEAARGLGLGRAALEFASELCARQGIDVLELEVEIANTRALSVYEKFGFTSHARYLMTRLIASAPGGKVD